MYSKDVIDRFSIIATASISDACNNVVGRRCFMDHEIKPRINEKKVVGPAVTIQEGPSNGEVCPPTHALDAIEDCSPGDVIVIALSNSDRDVAVWGGIMTAGAYVGKMAGAVLDAGLRDIAEIRRDYDFPVFSRSISPATTLGRYKTYASRVPVVCGGVPVNNGDLIVADVDGVVCVPAEHVEAVLEASEEIEKKELEQAKLIRETGSLKKGLEKYNRI